ncbi:MAG: amino acid ABC transporter substrate-binding protein [Alphaproteobacteria bacterium]|jgi:general L-amino acid transport system substrate-binding protein
MKKLAFVAAAGAVAFAGGAQADTLSDTIARGVLNCGVNIGVPGFAEQADDGSWSGLDVDVCRSVSAAIFGDADKVAYFPVNSSERFNKLNAGEYDLLSRNTTWTFSRDVDLGLSFQGVNYYDGQGFMVPTSLGVSSAADLDGATVCVQTGTTTELNLADFFADNGISYTPYVVTTAAETNEAYLAGLCDVYTTDASGLAANRTTFPDPSAHVILPEIVSKEPLGPVTRQGDEVWGDIVRWTLNAMIIAEELGITSANAADMAADADASAGVKRLLGVEGGYGAMLGLSDDAFLNALSQVGNYAESFERNVGPDTAVGLERGLNALWTDGGILYAPPFR